MKLNVVSFGVGDGQLHESAFPVDEVLLQQHLQIGQDVR